MSRFADFFASTYGHFGCYYRVNFGEKAILKMVRFWFFWFFWFFWILIYTGV